MSLSAGPEQHATGATQSAVRPVKFIAKLYRTWFVIPWLMGFSPFPDQIFPCTPSLTVVANGYGSLQAGTVFIVQLYFVYDCWLSYDLSSFISIVCYLVEVVYAVSILHAMWTGWKSAKTFLRIMHEIDAEFGDMFTKDNHGKVLKILLFWFTLQLATTACSIIIYDIPTYFNEGIVGCKTTVCGALIAFYYFFWRLHVLWKRIMESLVMFTAVFLSLLVKHLMSDDCKVSLRSYRFYRLCHVIAVGNRLFSHFSLVFATHRMLYIAIPAFNIGRTFARVQQVNWHYLIQLGNSVITLVAMGFAYVKLRESMTHTSSVLQTSALKTEQYSRSIDKTAKDLRCDSEAFTVGGITLTRDYCLTVAGAVFTTAILFAELGHGQSIPDGNWVIGQVESVLQNETVVMLHGNVTRT